MNAIETVVQRAHRNEKAAKTFITICGIGMALVPLLIGAFLFVKGTDTFFTFGHSVTEFLFSGQWKPSDTAVKSGLLCSWQVHWLRVCWRYLFPCPSAWPRQFI